MNHMKRMPIDPEVALPQVEKIIFQLAHKFSNMYPIPYDECLSEGYMAFMRACEDYNPKRKMKFSSWVYYWVWCKLKDLVMKRSKEPVCFVEINDDLTVAAPAVKSECLDLVAEMSSDAKEIISLLIETPRELIGVAMTPRQYMSRVKGHLVRKGRCPKEVDKAHKELTIRFQEAWA